MGNAGGSFVEDKPRQSYDLNLLQHQMSRKHQPEQWTDLCTGRPTIHCIISVSILSFVKLSMCGCVRAGLSFAMLSMRGSARACSDVIRQRCKYCDKQAMGETVLLAQR